MGSWIRAKIINKLTQRLQDYLEELNREYSIMSGHKGDMLFQTNMRTARATKIRSASDSFGGFEGLDAINSINQIKILDEIAEQDWELDKRNLDYEEEGGDPRRSVLQGCVRGEIYPFVPSYMALARPLKRINDRSEKDRSIFLLDNKRRILLWRRETKKMCRSMKYSTIMTDTDYREAIKVINGITETEHINFQTFKTLVGLSRRDVGFTLNTRRELNEWFENWEDDWERERKKK